MHRMETEERTGQPRRSGAGACLGRGRMDVRMVVWIAIRAATPSWAEDWMIAPATPETEGGTDWRNET